MANHVIFSPQTSISPRTVSIPNGSTAELLGPTPNRFALLLSSASVDFSLSFSPTVVLGKSTFNFFANIPFFVCINAGMIGNGIFLPLYGTAGGSGVTIEITEIIINEVQIPSTLFGK